MKILSIFLSETEPVEGKNRQMPFSLGRFWRGVSFQFAQCALMIVFALICVALPFRHQRSSAGLTGLKANFPGWSAAPVRLSHLKMMPLDAKTQQFATGFPGKIGIFSDGHETWIVRWVFEPTRKLHPSSDCLRAAGYKIKPGRASLDAQGRLWSSCLASSEGSEMKVCERIVGSRGGKWADVSSWFWQATWNRSTGPWWAVTTLDPIVTCSME